MHRPDDDKKAPETVHYIKFGNFHDVVSNFRLVAAWDPDEDRRLPVLFEGLLMTYLGLQTDGEDSPHHPLSTYQLNRELREGLDLPDFMGISLNRAWPLFAGIGFYADGNDHYKCANPKCNSKWNYGRWCDPPEGIGINGRICRRCSVFSRQYPGCVWPVKPDGLACAGYGVDGKLAHCENPGHPSDRDAKERVYRLNRQEIPRCRFCVGWVRYHKHDYPINVNGEDVTQPKPANVCANPGHKDTWNEYKTVYVAEDDGILRCAMCRKWRVANDGNDYPIDKNGLDHSTLSYDRCLNPNHPSNTPHNKVSFSDVMRQVRCWRCLRWASTWGQDFPAKKPKVPKAPTVPTAPKKKWESTTPTWLGLRCARCRVWMCRNNRNDYPFDRNGQEVSPSWVKKFRRTQTQQPTENWVGSSIWADITARYCALAMSFVCGIPLQSHLTKFWWNDGGWGGRILLKWWTVWRMSKIEKVWEREDDCYSRGAKRTSVQ